MVVGGDIHRHTRLWLDRGAQPSPLIRNPKAEGWRDRLAEENRRRLTRRKYGRIQRQRGQHKPKMYWRGMYVRLTQSLILYTFGAIGPKTNMVFDRLGLELGWDGLGWVGALLPSTIFLLSLFTPPPSRSTLFTLCTRFVCTHCLHTCLYTLFPHNVSTHTYFTRILCTHTFAHILLHTRTLPCLALPCLARRLSPPRLFFPVPQALSNFKHGLMLPGAVLNNSSVLSDEEVVTLLLSE